LPRQDLKKCDFTAMYDYFMAQRELKKQMPKEVCVLYTLFFASIHLRDDGTNLHSITARLP
jgi:hypothetical protein